MQGCSDDKKFSTLAETKDSAKTINGVDSAMLMIGKRMSGTIPYDSHFKINDTLHLYLLYPTKFGTSKLIFRISKKDLKSEGYRVLIDEEVPISPEFGGYKMEYPVRPFYEASGKGKYQYEFIIKDSSIAVTDFVLE